MLLSLEDHALFPNPIENANSMDGLTIRGINHFVSCTECDIELTNTDFEDILSSSSTPVFDLFAGSLIISNTRFDRAAVETFNLNVATPL